MLLRFLEAVEALAKRGGASIYEAARLARLPYITAYRYAHTCLERGLLASLREPGSRGSLKLVLTTKGQELLSALRRLRELLG